MGLIGGLGAVPGTLFAYPLDILKIRMQSTNSGGYQSAIRFVVGGSQPGQAGAGVLGFYRGVAPAIELRIIARGSMFLCSELCTQLIEGSTSLSGVSARCVGSIGSGYATGVLAGIAEYRKKMLSQGIVTACEARYGALLGSAIRSGQGRSLMLRLHGAGIRSAANDSCFFSVQHHLSKDKGWSAPASYASAAACGVVGAYLFDTAVARMMLVPPCRPVEGLWRNVLAIVRERSQLGLPTRASVGLGALLTGAARGVRGGYRGLGARAGEFAISYGCTGVVSAWLATAVIAQPNRIGSGVLPRDILPLWHEPFGVCFSDGAAVAAAASAAFGLFA